MIPFLAVLATALVAASDPAAEAATPAPSTTAESPPAPPATSAPTAAVDEIQVTAARARVVGNLQTGVVNYRPEFFTPVRPGTALDMVNWLPGFTFEDTRDMRGIEGSTGNVLIDGKPPTSKTDTLNAVLRRIPADQVERVDIIVGGAPGIDMHGRSIIANVILKAGATAQRLFSVADYFDFHGREYPDVLLTSSEKHGDRVIEGSIEVSRNTGFFPQLGYGPWTRLDGTGATEFAADTNFLVGGTTAVGTGLYQFPLAGGALKVNVAGRYYHYLWGERDTVTPGPGFYSWQEKDLYDQAELGVHYERSFGRTTFETQALERLSRNTTSDNDQRPPSPSLFNTAGGLQESALRAVVKFRKDDTLNVEAFAEEAFNTDNTRTIETANGVAQTIAGSDVAVTERRSETGATLSWKPLASLGLDTTMKLESSDIAADGDVSIEHSLTYWKPRAVVSWSLNKDTQVRLRVEHEVGQINFASFATYAEYATSGLRLGNADIRPQRDWVAEAVLERHFWNGADLTLTYRRMTLQDVVDVAPILSSSGVGGEITNIGDGHETDVIANLTLPRRGSGSATP